MNPIYLVMSCGDDYYDTPQPEKWYADEAVAQKVAADLNATSEEWHTKIRELEQAHHAWIQQRLAPYMTGDWTTRGSARDTYSKSREYNEFLTKYYKKLVELRTTTSDGREYGATYSVIEVPAGSV